MTPLERLFFYRCSVIVVAAAIVRHTVPGGVPCCCDETTRLLSQVFPCQDHESSHRRLLRNRKFCDREISKNWPNIRLHEIVRRLRQDFAIIRVWRLTSDFPGMWQFKVCVPSCTFLSSPGWCSVYGSGHATPDQRPVVTHMLCPALGKGLKIHGVTQGFSRGVIGPETCSQISPSASTFELHRTFSSLSYLLESLLVTVRGQSITTSCEI